MLAPLWEFEHFLNLREHREWMYWICYNCLTLFLSRCLTPDHTHNRCPNPSFANCSIISTSVVCRFTDTEYSSELRCMNMCPEVQQGAEDSGRHHLSLAGRQADWIVLLIRMKAEWKERLCRKESFSYRLWTCALLPLMSCSSFLLTHTVTLTSGITFSTSVFNPSSCFPASSFTSLFHSVKRSLVYMSLHLYFCIFVLLPFIHLSIHLSSLWSFHFLLLSLNQTSSLEPLFSHLRLHRCLHLFFSLPYSFTAHLPWWWRMIMMMKTFNWKVILQGKKKDEKINRKLFSQTPDERNGKRRAVVVVEARDGRGGNCHNIYIKLNQSQLSLLESPFLPPYVLYPPTLPLFLSLPPPLPLCCGAGVRSHCRVSADILSSPSTPAVSISFPYSIMSWPLTCHSKQ